MKFISGKDPATEPFKKAFSREIKQCQTLGMSYWIGVDDNEPVAFLMVGQEPIRLVAPIGTIVALLGGLASDRASATYFDMAKKSTALVREYDVDHIFLNLNSTKHKDAISQFQKAGFSVLVHSCHMQVVLDDEAKYSGNLKFKRVERDAMDDFVSSMYHFMRDASDEMLSIVLGNFGKLPDQMLDMLYANNEFYFAYSDKNLVAILNLSPETSDNIANIGVSPDFRGQGYGRQTLHFAMDSLRRQGLKKAQVRVSVANKPAIGLYESLGFKETQKDTALIWWNKENSQL